ncbi:hypothetical protein [Nostoc sp. FACHB-145]|uniref:hypothetical protein n=1 Tax=Nostoc sp. FACHB-145 TaxID=2692836 RepID=UPI0016837249|nr:hypothetical protein [Nostoc sp. FACHB-145]MBD2472391.1 hypothetical protein [Nostoc sp. FACHB-145]
MVNARSVISGFNINFDSLCRGEWYSRHSVDRKVWRSLRDEYLSKWIFVKN